MMLFAIALHEFGHFSTAKYFGIKVERFFIGFGPRLWSFRRGETEYGFNWLPLGGYVRIAGMNPFEEIPAEDRARVFKAKKPWQRAIVLAAGSTMHFLLALAVIIGLFATAGRVDREPHILTTIESVTRGSPADAAGLKPGDRIVAVGAEPVASWNDVRAYIRSHPGEPVTFIVDRNGSQATLTATLASSVPGEQGRVGFLGVGPETITEKPSVAASIGGGFAFVGRQMGETLRAIAHIFAPSTLRNLWNEVRGKRKRSIDDPASVVGLARAAGGFDAVQLLFVFVGFNIFVGVANLLPLPPLDGGHLAVLTYEKIRGREVDMRRLIPITATVMTVLVSLFLLLFYLDLVKPLPTVPG